MSEGQGIEIGRQEPIPNQTVTTKPPSMFRKLSEGIGNVVRSLDIRDRKIAAEDISEIVVAEAVDRLTHVTKENPFDIKSVAAELGYHGDSKDPDELKAADAIRRQLYSLQLKGAAQTIILDEPNQHGQRVEYRLTEDNRQILRGILAGK